MGRGQKTLHLNCPHLLPILPYLGVGGNEVGRREVKGGRDGGLGPGGGTK